MAKDNNLKDLLTDVANAIREKKGTTEKINPQDFSNEIRSIEGGGVVIPTACEWNDVNFYDYEGTILYSYTWDEFVEKNEMPPLPTHHKGLICQEWNYTLEEVLEQGGRCDVGAIYIPEDGNTHIIINTFYNDFEISLHIRSTKSVVIDWGDGNTENVEDTNYIVLLHTYKIKGEYDIAVKGECYFAKDISNSAIEPNIIVTKFYAGNNLSSFGTGMLNTCRNLIGITLTKKSKSAHFIASTINLKHVNIPKGSNFEYIAYRNTHIETISFPNKITLGSQSLLENSRIRKFYLPNELVVENALSWGKDNLINIDVGKLNKTLKYNGTVLIKDETMAIAGILAIIPENITTIKSRAFLGGATHKIHIPSTVTAIEASAFAQCKYVSNGIIIPKGVINIPNQCFYNCTRVPYYDFRNHEVVPTLVDTTAFQAISTTCKIVVPDTIYDQWIVTTNWVTYANRIIKANHTIIYESSDNSVIIPNSNADFGADIETNTCTNSTGYMIFNGPVTSIGDNGFNSETNLVSIIIPDSVTNIGSQAFYSCTNLKNIEIGAGVSNLGTKWFLGCTSLESIVVSEDNTVFDSRDNCNAVIETSTNKLKVGCKNTIIPNTVTQLDGSCFEGCTGLTSIIFPESLYDIGGWAFRECDGLTNITIPATITTIGSDAFRHCSNLRYAICESINPPTLGSDAFIEVHKDFIIYVPNTVVEIYQQATNWVSYADKIKSIEEFNN